MSARIERSTSSTETSRSRSSVTSRSRRRTRRGPRRSRTGSDSETDRSLSVRRCAEQENIDETRCALAMIENQDANVGRVLAKLDELKLADNTIVLYFSRQRSEQLALERRHEGTQREHRRRGRAFGVLHSLACEAACWTHVHADRRRDRPAADADRTGRRAARRRQTARWSRSVAAAAQAIGGRGRTG